MSLQVVRWVEHEEAPAPLPSPPRAPLLTVERAQALRQLRSELVRRQAEWREAEARTRCATGWPEVDGLLGGGFQKGVVSSLGGALGAGATTTAARALARVGEQGELGAWVDAGGTLSAAGLAAQGVQLERMLWVRPPEGEVTWTIQQLARSGAFALVVADWPAGPSGLAHAQRLAEAARAGGCAVVLLSGAGAAPASFKARLDAAVERPGLLRVVSDPGAAVSFGEGVQRRVRLWVERSRRGGETSARVRLRPFRAPARAPGWLRSEPELTPPRTGPDEPWGDLPVRPLLENVHTRARSRFRDGGQPVPTGRVNPALPELPSMRAQRALEGA